MGKITMKAMPFDSEVNINPDTGQEEYDRVAHSRDLADWLAAYFSNGILVQGSDMLTNELQILYLSAMTCVVKPGIIVINGRTGFLESQETIEFAVGGSNPRIDRVVAELNIAERNVYIKILKGTASAVPTAPEVTQTEDIYQIPLAQVRINANQAVIAAVTDERKEHISNVLLNQAPRTDVTADNIKLSSVVAALYGLTTDNANVDKALEANPPKKEVIEKFTHSRTWIVPEKVVEADIFIVSAGFKGGKPANSSQDRREGGNGGTGGSVLFIPKYTLTPNSSISILIGINDGGISKFNGITPEIKPFDLISNLCPIDGKIYGIPGAKGGYTLVGRNMEASVASSGDSISLDFADTLINTQGGIGYKFDQYNVAAGGGASADNNGLNGTRIPNDMYGGNGGSGNANTGNGGGGGGATGRDMGGVDGNGGLGGSGIVIVRYYA